MEVHPRNIRQSVLEMIYYSKSSHIGTCFSMIEILYTLYFKSMNIQETKTGVSAFDKFILSKAHGSAALYATLAERGFFEKDILKRYYVDNGILPGHLDKTKVPGVEISGGSLGHGLSIGVGMAIALKKEHVYVLLGDGECNEGSVWEAAMLASHMKLSNLTVVIDYNKLQGYGMVDAVINQSNMSERWKAFGWQAIEVDGHDIRQLETVLSNNEQLGPKAIIAHTIKGKGVSFMENQLAWHYKSPNEEQFLSALRELDENK